MPFHADDPVTLQFQDGHRWIVRAPIDWDDPDHNWTVTVPAGFVTDLASVPRGLWPLMPPSGRYAPAAIVHDYLYQHQRVGDVVISRGYADSVLRRASGDLGVPWRIRWPMYLGVRSFGWAIWRHYRGQDAA